MENFKDENGKVKNGFYLRIIEGLDIYCSVNGDKVLEVWDCEGIRSIHQTWHFDFSAETDVREISEMDFLEAMARSAAEYDQYFGQPV